MSDTLELLKAENAAAKKYLASAERFLREGKRSKAISMLEIASCAVRCGNKLHDEMWTLSNGKMNDEEFKAFCESEKNSSKLSSVAKQI